MPESAPTSCALCGRERPLSFHHLIPKKVHRRGHFKRNYEAAELQKGVHLCRLCHGAVHRLYDEMTLAKDYATLAALRQDPAVQKHVSWARKQKR